MITKNAVYCNNCQTEIESKYTHDFVKCKCKDPENQVFVDGGHDYFRMGAGKFANYIVLHETNDEEMREDYD